MSRVNIEEARVQLRSLIEAAMNGEEVLLAKDERHVVKLVPAPAMAAKPRPQFGSARVQIVMSEDFDAPLEDFEPYMR